MVPANVKSAYVSIAGGGAGGGGGVPYFVAGSSGGYLNSYPLNLTPGELIPISIGVGGSQNQNGGTTNFGGYLSCSGGSMSLFGPVLGGNCGTNGGQGVTSQYFGHNDENYGGYFVGGTTPMNYGSGGGSSKCWGCGAGTVSTGLSGLNGVVIVDVLY